MTAKKTAKKTTSTKKVTSTKAEPKAPEPMDASAEEIVAPAEAQKPEPRVAYALQTLVEEVHHLFPETPVEYASVDRRNTALEAVFDASVLDNEERSTFVLLLDCIEHDTRVKALTFDAETEGFSVLLHSNARTQDIRDPFSLNEAYLILIEAQEGITS